MRLAAAPEDHPMGNQTASELADEIVVERLLANGHRRPLCTTTEDGVGGRTLDEEVIERLD